MGYIFTLKSDTENLGDVSIGEIPASEISELNTWLQNYCQVQAAGNPDIFHAYYDDGYSAQANVFGGSIVPNYTWITFGARGISAMTMTPGEIKSNSTLNPSDALCNRLSNILNGAYNKIMATFNAHNRGVTNIMRACQPFLVYNWIRTGANPPAVKFKNGTYIVKNYRSSYSIMTTSNVMLSESGARNVIYKYANAAYEATYATMMTHPVSTTLYFAKGDSVEETFNNGKNGRYYLLLNALSYFSLNSNGEITAYAGRVVRVQGSTGTFLPASTTLDMLDPKEVHEDMDNTYPGGGNDENSYPDEGSEEPGGESGKGDFDNTNDPIDFPTLPTWDVQSTGFISLWNPTIVQLTDLYTFLWDSDISTTLKKLFNEPMNAIFSLGIIPVDPVTQGTRRLTIGHVDTEIDMESIQKQFVTFDFGSIDINEYYGAAWDYSPYTHASIYLPYIGVQSVDIDDIMNCTLTLRYNIDVLTGTTIALLKCVRKGRDNLNAVMYEWQGNCVTQCPITAGNWSQIMASVIQLGAMTGLALSQPVVGAIGSAVGSSAAAEYAQGKNLVNPTMATYGALNVLGSKVHVQRGGRLDMSSGAMSMQKAFVILNRPVSGIPRGWNKYAGYPSLKIKTLGSQEGFVSVGAIKLDGLRATAEEINELDTILKTGVII